MAAGEYNVQKRESSSGNGEDTSFRSCIHALLIVLFICLIGILIAYFVRSFLPHDKGKNDAFESQQRNNDDKLTTVFQRPTTVFQRLTTVLQKTTKAPEKATSKAYTVFGRTKEPKAVDESEISNTTTERSIENFTKTYDTTNEQIRTDSSDATTTQQTTKVYPIKTGRRTTSKTSEGTTQRYLKPQTLSNESSETPTPTTIEETTLVNTSSKESNKLTQQYTQRTPTTSTSFGALQTTIKISDSTPILANVTDFGGAATTIEDTTYISRQTSNRSSFATTTRFNVTVPITQSGVTTSRIPVEASTTPSTVSKATNTTFSQPALSSSSAAPTTIKSIISRSAEEVCETPVCRSTSAEILQRMNHSVDPCDDFYEFTCGRYGSSKKNSDDIFLEHLSNVDSTGPKFLRETRAFFESCMAQEGAFASRRIVDQVRLLLDNVGTFRINDSATVQDLSELMARLVLRHSVPFFDVGLSLKGGINGYALQLTLPQDDALEWSSLSENRRRCLRLQLGKTYEDDVNLTVLHEAFLDCQRNYSVYLDSVENVVRSLGLLEQVKNETEVLRLVKDLRFTVEDILRILEKLPSPYQVRQSFVNQESIVMTLDDVKKNFPQINWSIFMKTLTTANVAGANFVEVYLVDYFKEAFQEVALLGTKKIYNALLAIYAQDLYSNVMYKPIMGKRRDFCVKTVSELFKDAYNYVWATNTVGLDANRNITSIIFNKLKSQLLTSLDNAAVNWMEDDVLVRFKAKINKLSLRFSESGDFDVANLEKNYQNFGMDPENYAVNLEKALVRKRQLLYGLWGAKFQPEHIFQTTLDLTSNKPFYIPTENLIFVPNGMLQEAKEGVPLYLLMSSVGWRLAKELSRVFDPTNVKDSLRKTATYEALVVSTKDQLQHANEANLKGKRVALNLNGSLSVNERLVENAAFRLLVDASTQDGDDEEFLLPWISMSYSRDKIVFISVVQEFCKETTTLEYMERVYESEMLPAPLMVENVLINSQGFATAFDCKPGASMNPFEIRYQFPYLEKIEDYNNYDYH